MTEFSNELQNFQDYRAQNSHSGTKQPFDCFWSAWTAHVGSENDFACCVTDAIKLGHDTNGTAALAGSLSGLSNGLNDIPSKWLKILKLTGEVMEISQGFIDRVTQKVIAA